MKAKGAGRGTSGARRSVKAVPNLVTILDAQCRAAGRTLAPDPSSPASLLGLEGNR